MQDNQTALPTDMWEKVVQFLPPPPPKLRNIIQMAFHPTCMITVSDTVSEEELKVLRSSDVEFWGKSPRDCFHHCKVYNRQDLMDFVVRARVLGWDFETQTDLEKLEKCEDFDCKKWKAGVLITLVKKG